MLKHLRLVAFAVVAIFMFAPAFAQQMTLPVDTAVKIGKLDNGLTYYIRHNDATKGQADFYIAQKVGSILEEDNQRGLAHFLEHMCFNGTTNFPGNSLVDWLASKGIKFGADLNAYTGFDETVYYISNVPSANAAVQDSVLLILHDWANDLLLDTEEIDKERGVIHQEWRRSMVGEMRILENLLPTMYPGSKYGERLPIGTMEVVDNFDPQVIRDYYETWYRPDQQGIIVVGDIDVEYIENKIKEIFSSIEMPANAKERQYEPVPDTEGTIFAIGSDPEQTIPIIRFFFKTDVFPDEMKNTVQYAMTKYMLGMMSAMLAQRYNDIMSKPDAVFAQAAVSYGPYFVAKTKDALGLAVVPKGADTLGGFEAAYRELLRAARGGFTQGEYDRARAEYLSQLEKSYNGRSKCKNKAYVTACLENFTSNEPLLSIENEYEIMKNLAPQVPVEYINAILPQLIITDNRVLFMEAPEKEGFAVPTEEEFAEVIAKVEGEQIEAYVDDVKTEPLVPELPTPGKIVKVEDDSRFGAKVITLSNGVKVVVRPTDFKKDDIQFRAIAKGGTSTIGDDQANNLIYLSYAASQPTLGTYTNADMVKYLKGKQAGVGIELNSYYRTLSGTSSVKDMPTLMEMIYMYFTGLSLDENEFAATQNMISNVLANQEANPQYIFQRALMNSLFESAARQPISTEVVNNVNREEIEKIMHDALANAADYTFYFVGDIDMDSLTPLLEQYIATLPADAKTASNSYEVNTAREYRSGSATEMFTTKMENPQTWVSIIVSGNLPYTSKDGSVASILGQILTNRLIKKIREEMGAVYSISAMSNMSRVGQTNTSLQVPFPMKPEMRDVVLEEIHGIIYGLADEISEEELKPVKEYMIKTATEAKEINSALLGEMTGFYLNGVDTFNGDIEEIGSITVADIQNFAKRLLDQNNYRVLVLDPEK